jgi:hypothetical protein
MSFRKLCRLAHNSPGISRVIPLTNGNLLIRSGRATLSNATKELLFRHWYFS